MNTLKTKLSARTAALKLLYMVTRPTAWILAWLIVDFMKLVEFHRPPVQLDAWDTLTNFWEIELWPRVVPFMAIWLIDVFFVSPLYKKKVVRISNVA